ncbi:MAG: SRPBCC domain-containing protein [Micromonosporaceae bacterium]|nr:SRPBCC domain-containing protein [Micromonosporaceae bacterium]
MAGLHPASLRLHYAGDHLHNGRVPDDDPLFKALADPTRRALLDRLRERNGQTLGELCGPLAMARQSATQHLGVLEAASLITTVRRGREKLHYLNPVPLWEMQERWIERFEHPRLRALSAVKHRAEEKAMADRPSYVYVTYIESTAERVWEALTDAELTGAYWGHSNVSDWRVGSPWEHRRVDGSGIADVAGTVLESVPPRRLVMTFDAPGATPPQGPSKVTFEIEPHHEIVRLTVTHQNLADQAALEAISYGWPAVCANLKSLLETGHVLPRAPWEMHADVRAAQSR